MQPPLFYQLSSLVLLLLVWCSHSIVVYSSEARGGNSQILEFLERTQYQFSPPSNGNEDKKPEDPPTPQNTNSICIEQDSPDCAEERPRKRIKPATNGKEEKKPEDPPTPQKTNSICIEQDSPGSHKVDNSHKNKAEASIEATFVIHEHLRLLAEIMHTLQGACPSIGGSVNVLDLFISSKNRIEDGRKKAGRGVMLLEEGLSVLNEAQELLNTIEVKCPRVNLDTCSSITSSTQRK